MSETEEDKNIVHALERAINTAKWLEMHITDSRPSHGKERMIQLDTDSRFVIAMIKDAISQVNDIRIKHGLDVILK